MIVAVEIDRYIDLTLFSKFLFQANIWHRINETGAMQQVWVNSEVDKIEVQALYRRFASEEIRFEVAPVTGSNEAALNSAALKSMPRKYWLRQMLSAPFTLTLVLANIICFPITLGADIGQLGAWLQSFSLLEFTIVDGRPQFADLTYTLNSGQYWRLITPMLLHFGWLHIVFNLLWVWEIGKRIERVNGVLLLLLLVLGSSIVANILQYLIYGASLFGGMSGVVYGLLGYSMAWSKLMPAKRIELPAGVYLVMLIILGLGFTGLIDLLKIGNIANGAHLGGLLAGLGLGLLWGGIKRR
ncbi:MAG: rhomboid family intramembrane serine protease [Pseudomonadales bacterium]|nr:rhomboid family intramembrane serine protease [Pseudomonadales bacterium]